MWLFKPKTFSSIPEWDEYEIYHDESKDQGLTHGYLLVPIRTKPKLLEQIAIIRKRHNCDSKLHFTDLSGKTENIKHKTVKDLLIVMQDALRSKSYNHALWGDLPPSCKFVLFFKPNIRNMDSRLFGAGQISHKPEIEIRKVETLLRIGLKGGLHYLFSDENKIRINGFYTDGLSWCRPFDKSKVSHRLHMECRPYVDIKPDLDLVPVTSDHKSSDCKDYDRAQLLQACDCLLGAFKNSITGGDTESLKARISRPIRAILEKQEKRGTFFQRSGHHKSFTLTKGTLKEKMWEYSPIPPAEFKTKLVQEKQMDLFQ